MDSGNRYKGPVEGIVENCSHITFEGTDVCGVSGMDYVAFITSYGNQVVSIAPLKFSLNALQNITEACPNLRFDLFFKENELYGDFFEAVREIPGTVRVEVVSTINFSVCREV